MKDRFLALLTYIRSLDPRVRFLIGIIFILIGLFALVTPLTPGSWLVFVGLEFIGIRFFAWERIMRSVDALKNYLRKPKTDDSL